MTRRAELIWTPRQPPASDIGFRDLLRDGPRRREDGTNRWYLFRRAFVLPAAVTAAALDITVDGRYQLFVNGNRIGRGPPRCSPWFQRYDCYRLQPFLRQGDNVIAVLVHVYGVDTAWYETARDYAQTVFGDGGLYCDARIRCGDLVCDLQSDESWRCMEAPAWNRAAPRSGWGQDFIEDFDARRMPASWTEAGFDDSDWDPAWPMVCERDPIDRTKGWGPIRAFPTLVPSEIPRPRETPLAPVSVVALYGVVPRPELPLDRRLYEEPLLDLPAGRVEQPQALLNPDAGATTVRTAPGCDVALLLRFERLHAGYPFIELEARGGESVELAAAETYPGELGGEVQGLPRIARSSFLDFAHLFRYTARPGVQRFEKFEWTAVRYLQLVVRNAPEGLKIRHVGSLYTRYPAENRGAFECSDPMLNELWETGRYTVLQCTHDAWEDCPGREKRQWLGDGIVHFAASAAAFGPSTQAIDRRFFLQAVESQRADGLLQMFAPGDHHRDGIVIPDFSLHWICGAYDYFLHTGDEEAMELLFPALERLLAWFERHVGPHGLLVDLPHWHFIEWADVGREGEAAIVNAMLAGALAAAAGIADVLGYERAAARYRTRRARIREALNARHWDAERGVYVDTVDRITAQRGRKVSQQANAAMIVWGVAPPSRWPSMIARTTDPERLRLTAVPPVVPVGERFDAEHDVVRANSFFSHFVYSALARAGRFDLALAQIRRYYAPMLAGGTGTLWESFDPAASLCHAFSATPVHQLSAHVLGVQPVTPGFARFRVAPQPCDLAFARGTYPTVRGDVNVEWRLDGARLGLELIVPHGCEAEIAAPAGFAGAPQRPSPAGRHVFALHRVAA